LNLIEKLTFILLTNLLITNYFRKINY